MAHTLVSEEIEKYSESFTTPETDVLAALNRSTSTRHDARMLSGHIQGALLQMLSHMIKPKYVLELGTFTGYSAICLAQGLQQGGHLHTIDVSNELTGMAASYIADAGLTSAITQHIGKAADIIPTLDYPFNLVFIDADKGNYSLYYDLVFEKVPVGGYIVADNVLFHGEVILPTEEQGKAARSMHAYNQKIATDPRVEQLLLPVRDGLMIARKVSN
ncbi:MAG: O-methyltransferase [Taibaiella sp.]|nr:O-methyltransferase [Taibaiella sp.]